MYHKPQTICVDITLITHTPIEKALVYLKNIPNSHVLCVYLHIFYNKKLSPTPKTALTFNNGINIKYL